MNVGKVQNATAAHPINSWKLFPNAISHSPAFLFSIGQRNQHISISTTRISHGVIRRATLHPLNTTEGEIYETLLTGWWWYDKEGKIPLFG